ncbi:MAG: MBL fold metallo-hydrolase [Peptostreptococcaceae bacterium]|nr:MBL fold metallo-hydrolase [Peptostreptococcaceae bacterium]
MKDLKHSASIYKDFENHDRFNYPENLKRVTAGMGGEAILIFTDKYTSLYDTGMAYCAENFIKNIKEALIERGRDKIDYIFISHTHYDHVGALPYVIDEWPDAIICGSLKAKKVFESKGARNLMKALGEKARDNFVHSDIEIRNDNFRIDKVVSEGDEISLGSSYMKVLETKGHTDCSLTFVLEPESIMFCSESTGVLRSKGDIHSSILKSYKDAIESAIKCREYKPKQLLSPHFGMIPNYYIDTYFELYIEESEREKNMILDLRRRGKTLKEIQTEHEKKYWSDERSKAQPKAAYIENRNHTINCIIREFED